MMKWLSTVALALAITVMGWDGLAQGDASSENTYIAEHSFETTCDKGRLLQILFGFEHLRHFMTDVDDMSVAAETKTTYQVTYNYHYLWYKNVLVMEKSIQSEKNRVAFKLLRTWDNVSFLPELIDVQGFYEIREKDKSTRIIYYHQKSVFDDSLGPIYRSIMKSRIQGHIESLQEYIEEACQLI